MTKPDAFPLIRKMTNNEILTGVDGGLRRECAELLGAYADLQKDLESTGETLNAVELHLKGVKAENKALEKERDELKEIVHVYLGEIKCMMKEQETLEQRVKELEELLASTETAREEWKKDSKYNWEQYELRTKERNEANDETKQLQKENAALVSKLSYQGDLTNRVSLLTEALKEAIEALNYYEHPVHYEERETMGGMRPPGVMTDRGNRARETLDRLKGVLNV